MSIATRPLPVVALLAALAAPAANAQDVQYSTVTKVDLGGGMNAILRMAGASEVKRPRTSRERSCGQTATSSPPSSTSTTVATSSSTTPRRRTRRCRSRTWRWWRRPRCAA